MKGFVKVVLVIIACGLIINICRLKFSDMQENETYVSSTNSNVKIELTKEDEEILNDYGELMVTNHIAYLYVDGETYKGDYKLFVSNAFKKELWVNFYGYNENDNNPGGALHEYFQIKRNKLVLKDDCLHEGIFLENHTFVKKTWWNTWGKKIVIVLAILFVIWLLKELPKLLKDKEFVQDFVDDLKEDHKETVNYIIEDIKDIKDPYNNKKNES